MKQSSRFFSSELSIWTLINENMLLFFVCVAWSLVWDVGFISLLILRMGGATVRELACALVSLSFFPSYRVKKVCHFLVFFLHYSPSIFVSLFISFLFTLFLPFYFLPSPFTLTSFSPSLSSHTSFCSHLISCTLFFICFILHRCSVP